MKNNKLPRDFINKIYAYAVLKSDHFTEKDFLNYLKINNLQYYENLFHQEQTYQKDKKILSAIRYRLYILYQKGILKEDNDEYIVEDLSSDNENLNIKKRKFPDDLMERIYKAALNYNCHFYVDDIESFLYRDDLQCFEDLLEISNYTQISAAITYRLNVLCIKNIIKKDYDRYIVNHE